jgi:hypothetical protein
MSESLVSFFFISGRVDLRDRQGSSVPTVLAVASAESQLTPRFRKESPGDRPLINPITGKARCTRAQRAAHHMAIFGVRSRQGNSTTLTGSACER